MSSRKSIAFFGGTGGALNRILVSALEAGHLCVVLARTPDKLTNIIQRKLQNTNTLDNLKVIPGSASDFLSVKTTLSHHPDLIFSGLSSTPKLKYSLLRPLVMEDPNLIRSSAHIVVKALSELKAEAALSTSPIFVPISSTGLGQEGVRDVPFILIPVYAYLLAMPQADTRAMEEQIVKAVETENTPLGGYVFVRPTLLSDKPARGTQSLRIGWDYRRTVGKEESKGPGPTIGYTVGREDLGCWMFEQLIERDARKWNGKYVTVTY